MCIMKCSILDAILKRLFPKTGQGNFRHKRLEDSLREMVSVAQPRGSIIQDRGKSEGLSGGISEECYGMKHAETENPLGICHSQRHPRSISSLPLGKMFSALLSVHSSNPGGPRESPMRIAGRGRRRKTRIKWGKEGWTSGCTLESLGKVLNILTPKHNYIRISLPWDLSINLFERLNSL